MHSIRLLYSLFTLFLVNSVFSQTVDSNTFNITGKITGPHSDIVVLRYTDAEDKNAVDSFTVKNGRFQFTGTVNRISDAYLWTDTSNRNFSDHSVVRFLLEPKNIHIVYDKGIATITGSDSQAEKENFDKEKSVWVIPENQFRFEMDSLYRLCESHPDPRIKKRIDELYGKISFIKESIKPIDMEYIRAHPDSYLSGFLLSSYKRGLSIDTLQAYYSALSPGVKSSGEGRKVIRYIYPLTNDKDFRDKNPLYGVEYNKRLDGVHSVYDLSVSDLSGNPVALKAFKGQYLVIDFWASWCKPCIENFPFMEKLMEKYESDPVQFISVSLDTDSARWKEAIKKYHLTGIQLSDLKGFDGLLPVYCKVVTGIPRYVLIDKEGKIINFDAPHPMNPELGMLIAGLLKKDSYN